MPIILTADQAAKVRGRSPKAPWCAIDPQPLKDGTFALPEAVLTDPAHEDVAPLLKGLSVVPDKALDTVKFDATKPDDAAALASLNLPKWEEVGLRASSGAIAK